eukprot:TRINITY_DN8846_c0_g1_i1.p1 TRINITY_DN8846_c0_g1~~TRINITY_DN8846_c0_g1_i1.p1  ORF type:complete len:336 (+),score=17.49 TRINITY_DN8846_c0_g1_i1:55-1008(+)
MASEITRRSYISPIASPMSSPPRSRSSVTSTFAAPLFSPARYSTPVRTIPITNRSLNLTPADQPTPKRLFASFAGEADAKTENDDFVFKKPFPVGKSSKDETPRRLITGFTFEQDPTPKSLLKNFIENRSLEEMIRESIDEVHDMTDYLQESELRAKNRDQKAVDVLSAFEEQLRNRAHLKDKLEKVLERTETDGKQISALEMELKLHDEELDSINTQAYRMKQELSNFRTQIELQKQEEFHLATLAHYFSWFCILLVSMATLLFGATWVLLWFSGSCSLSEIGEYMLEVVGSSGGNVSRELETLAKSCFPPLRNPT